MSLFGRRGFLAGMALLIVAWWATPSAGDDNETIWNGRSGGFSIAWRTDRLELSDAGKLAMSFKALAEREWSRVREGADNRALRMEKTYAVLSAVGPWLSVQAGTYCDCGGAHPTAVLGVYAYDLRESRVDSGAPANLSSLFPADAILSALLDNDAIRTALKDASLAPPRTLPELIDALAFKTVTVGDCDFVFNDALLSSFALHHIDGDKVAVRFGLLPAAEICRGLTTQIEILLPVTETIRASLLAARDGSGGLLMEKAESMAAGRTTAFTFSFEPGQGRN